MPKHLAAIAVVAGVAVGCGSSAGTRATTAASCIGPQLTLSDNVASPGSSLSADGEWFAADCYDTGQASDPPPLTDLTVSIVQNGKTWQLASGVDATGDHYAFHVPLVLPTGLTPGKATVRVGGYRTAALLQITRS